jgi:hypothetical protein
MQTELSAAEAEMAAVREQLVAVLRDKEEVEDICEKKVKGQREETGAPRRW